MKHVVLTLIASMISLPFNVSAAGEDPTEGIDIETTQVDKNLFMLSGKGGFSGGNVVALTGEDGLLIVDDKMRSMTKKLSTALNELAGSSPHYVLNTHWHADHTGNNEHFGSTATIVAHEHVRKMLSARQRIESLDMEIPATAEVGLPEITYSEEMNVHFNDEVIRIRHYPNGHTDGDSVIHFVHANVLHTGDLMFTGMYPYIDLEHGGDVKGFIESLQGILRDFPHDAKVIPGHGELTTMDEIEKTVDMMEGTAAIVEKAMDSGKSLERIRAEGLGEEWAAWDGPLISEAAWIGIVHASLLRQESAP